MAHLQVDGFRYECSLNGMTLTASLNTTDGTVSCSDGVSVFVTMSIVTTVEPRLSELIGDLCVRKFNLYV